jgi:uncharacterized OsmC-like protein
MITDINGIDLGALKRTIAAVQQDPELGRCRFRASNRWQDGTRNVTRLGPYRAAKQEHEHAQPLEAASDEPPLLAGGDTAPNPVEHLLTALASCLTTSLVAHAAVRGIPIEEVESQIEGDIDLAGFFGLKRDVPKGYQHLHARFRVRTDADQEQLRELANFSPVFNTLRSGVDVQLEFDQEPVMKLTAGTETTQGRREPPGAAHQAV